MLPEIKYFTKSLKVIRNDTLQQGMHKYLLVFHTNHVDIVLMNANDGSQAPTFSI